MQIAIIGMGQIARSHHIPAIVANPNFTLAATVDPSGKPGIPDVPSFGTLDELLRSDTQIDAVVICTPPLIRYAIARQALDAGLHVMLEKPPAQTASEALVLLDHAIHCERTIFGTWHSCFSRGVAQARDLVACHGVRDATLTWRENSARWHPGTDWFWGPAGFGAFDAGINGISLLQAILPARLLLRRAVLQLRRGEHAPVSAVVDLTIAASPLSSVPAATLGADIPITGFFDCGYDGPDETWIIAITLGDGRSLNISEGGARVELDGETIVLPIAGNASSLDDEYPRLYEHFGGLLHDCKSEVDVRPLQLVTDILAFGRREIVEP